MHIKALTAVEIAHIARIEKMSARTCSSRCARRASTRLPGGGAETFSAAVRDVIADKKLGGADYIDVHRTAHRLGIRSNCTMLYGHVETIEDRIEHLTMLRDLQDETGGFLAYIPLAYHPDDNELGKTLDRQGTASTGFDDLRNLAVGRLFLDNFEHIKSHWIMVTPGGVADRAALRRQRHRGHRRAREDLSRGRGAHAAGHDARRAAGAHSRRRQASRPSAIRSIASCANFDDDARSEPADAALALAAG